MGKYWKIWTDPEDLWGNNKKSNICVIGLERLEGEAEKIFEEILAKNFPNFVKEINLQIEDAENLHPLPKGIHSKENHAQSHHDQTAEN